MKKKLLSKKKFKSIYTKVPRLCVELVIIKNGKILLTKRSIPPLKGFWHIPGKGVLFREKIKESIARTAKKELGIKVYQEKFLGYAESLKDGFRHGVSLIFKCKIDKNQKLKTLEGASEFKFFNKLPKKIVPFHKKFLKIHFKNFLREI